MDFLQDQQLGENTRKSFSRMRFNLDLPDLVEIQTKSYRWFLETGLNEVLNEISPITDFSNNLSIDFLSYTLEEKPNYTVEECKERDANYAASLKVRVRLTNRQTEEVKETDIFMGDFPLMTENGTFVINGAERVIVSQLIRSPGMYYSSDIDKTGKRTFAAQILPYRGAWLEYETDAYGALYVRIDRTRKVPITMLIRALDASLEKRESIYQLFGEDERLKATFERDDCETLAEEYRSTAHNESLKEIYKKLRPGEPPTVESSETLLNNYFFDPRRYDIAPVGRYKFNQKLALHSRIANRTLDEEKGPVVSPLTGEIVCEAGAWITPEKALEIERAGVNEVWLRAEDGASVKVLSNNTLEPEYLLPVDLRERLAASGSADLRDCGVRDRVRIAPMMEILKETEGDLEQLKREVRGRLAELCPKHITRDDILASISYILNLGHGVGSLDDIDHLGNRRVRSVGEQLQNQFRIGFVRMEKIIKERMTTQDSDKLTPQALINIRPVSTVIREFFGSSQLSQFADQNNPLAELTHRRRLSALGPGGLSRDRASFDVRDVHYTHYGRMCPIETPEGPNIGLISYLTTYARISEYGFIEAPYRRVVHEVGPDGTPVHRVTDEVTYMTADVEDRYVVAQANEPLDERGCFINRRVTARERTEIASMDPARIDYMDVSPKMVVSVATAMIPFLENDDNSRALMGANMQKQAVPLMVSESPIVGTGMEYKVAMDSGVVVIARRDGRVSHVEADRIVVEADDGTKDTYLLRKFKRTNQGTCFNHKPIVQRGQPVRKGQVIADGSATDHGEIALGKNALVGFMTWEGYNYEDAVLLNERLVRDDVYTSIHIEEYSHEARDTKLGPEEITREIPNVGEDVLKDLNSEGIVRIGTEVRAGDILVGKITPKGETELTAEERLLRAIFGEKAKEVRDTSLRLPHGESGVVVNIRVFSREAGDDLPASVNRVVKVYIAQKRKISVGDKMAGRHGNKGVVSRILPPEDMPFLPDGTPLDIVLNPLGVPSRMNIGQVLEVHLGIAARRLGWRIMTPVFDGASERDISECLRLAGYARPLFAGENPESKELYEMTDGGNGEPEYRLLTPEERADPACIERLRQADRLRLFDGKMVLHDGRTGEPFDNPVTVGIMYYLKLHHLVDDKIHARSNGPYSLVTQQPLGGKAQFGGQRFGEMEVWALEAYGAAYTLQEILTVKSDDITGRRRAYEAIIKGQNIPRPGVPESFKVLVKELQALALDVRVLNSQGEEVDLFTAGKEDARSAYRRQEDEPDEGGGEAEDASAGYQPDGGDDADGFDGVEEDFPEEGETFGTESYEDDGDLGLGLGSELNFNLQDDLPQ